MADYIEITELPRFLKDKVIVPHSALTKTSLDTALVETLEDFFSIPRLILSPDEAEREVVEIRNPNTIKILSKLRSLLEKQARKDIGQYRENIRSDLRSKLIRELHRAGIHHFRENIETDLYVGIHTAISANFKMIGVVFTNPLISLELRGSALDLLFKALRCVASYPLGVLLALDGLFWDRQLYSIPTGIVWDTNGPKNGTFYLNRIELETRLEAAEITEIPLGCPAMRARTNIGAKAIDLLQNLCTETANRYCKFEVR